MTIRLFCLFIFCFTALRSVPVCAEPPPPVPQNKAYALKGFEARLEEEKAQRAVLAEKVEKLDAEVSGTRKDLVTVAALVRQNERDLREMETKIDRLEEKKNEIEDKLKKDRLSISRLLVALERIRRVPPEAMLARPDSPYKDAQSALLMRDIIPAINRHAQTLRVNLETLGNIAQELQVERDKVVKAAADLKDRQEELASLLEKRESLYRETHKDLRAHEVEIQQISLQAKNLEDLLARLEEERKAAVKREQTRIETEVHDSKIASVVRKKPDPPVRSSRGNTGPQLPASGIIRVRYGQKSDLGSKSEGITIETRPGGLVVAPIAGKIQFAGVFKRYGNIVIIQHTGGFHSLVAGLDKIDTVVGQSVDAGEPLGVMPNSSLAARPKLYYELRKNGQPVNPAVKFPDLG